MEMRMHLCTGYVTVTSAVVCVRPSFQLLM